MVTQAQSLPPGGSVYHHPHDTHICAQYAWSMQHLEQRTKQS